MARYPWGVCQIEYTLEGEETPVIMDLTMEDEETTFDSSYEMYSVGVDQMQGPYIATISGGETTFTCSIPLDTTVLPKLSNAFIEGQTGLGFSTTGKEFKFGKLKIHPISAGESTDHDIIGPRVSCIVNSHVEFKKEGKSLANLTFNFSTDITEESPTKGMIFTIGNYTAKAE